MWNSAYMHNRIISAVMKILYTNQTFAFMSSKVVYVKKHLAYQV